MEAHARVVSVTVILQEDGAVERLGRTPDERTKVGVSAETLVRLMLDCLFAGSVDVVVKPTVSEADRDPAIADGPRLVERHQRVNNLAHPLGRVVYDDAFLADTKLVLAQWR